MPVMHLGLSIEPFPGYMRDACPDILVHIQALLAESSPSCLLLCSVHACTSVVYATATAL